MAVESWNARQYAGDTRGYTGVSWTPEESAAAHRAAAGLPPVQTCRDSRCTDGVTWCAGCHGHGVLNPRGKRYRIACKQLPAWAVPHDACNGTGLRACGCRPLSAGELATLGGDQRAAAS